MSRGRGGSGHKTGLAETYKERIPGREEPAGTKVQGLSMEEGSEARTQRLVRKADQPRVRCWAQKRLVLGFPGSKMGRPCGVQANKSLYPKRSSA